ncbi:MAG TPA: hypothetical protein VM925_21570 [Labilithrix sp.]|jgi:hypothetical protein|nr:hypothetical protein [Labilithrix sp.]
MTNRHLASITLLGLLSLSLANCTSTYTDICTKEKDCEGGNDKDVDACIERLRGQEDVAAAYDCSDAFDKALDCAESTATCKDKNFATECKSQNDALESCTEAASGTGK